MKRWLFRIAIGLAAFALLIAVLAGDFVRSFRRTVPSYEGTRQVAGLTAPVDILRDGYAIPHIRAATFEDAAYGLGYVHAQDRLWQMEVSRRYIQGRLAEVFGADAVSSDSFMRSLGLYRASIAAVPHLVAPTRRALDAYARGVNAYIAGRRGRWPIEFVLGGVKPEPWRPQDSIAVLKGMALMLSGNAGAEDARVRLAGVLGRRGVSEFVRPFDEAPLPAWLDEIYGATQLGLARGIPETAASNNWVVSGARSESGKPLLANDPHLGLTIPSTWYLAHLALPGEDIAGGTLPGIPAIVAGRNRHVAWGMTNTEPDTQDLYLERLDPDSPRRYQTPAGWAEFQTRVETIRVRFGEPRRITVRSTRHGPVMEDEPGLPYEGATPRGYVLAFAWTALAPNDTTMQSVIAINHAKNADEFRAATQAFVAPMQNVVYADDSGTHGRIGLVLPGRVPLRAAPNDALGLVPAKGWEGAYDWQGLVRPEEAVQILDPPHGSIATANNRTAPSDYPHSITREWDLPYRYDRIVELLATRSRHSVESFRAIQLDTIDRYALILRPRLLAAGPFAEGERAAADIIARWNGAMHGARPAPLIFAAWARALAQRLYADELGPSFEQYWGYRPDFTLRVLDDVQGAARWCDDKTTVVQEDCRSRIRLALADAVAELRAAYGDEPEAWRWSEAHPALHRSRPLGELPMIGSWFARQSPTDGGAFTILRADHRMAAERPYAAVHGAGYRGIYDLGEPDASLYMVNSGQSEHFYSPHYDDLMPLWSRGDYVRIPFTPAAVESSAKYRMRLQPLSGVR